MASSEVEVARTPMNPTFTFGYPITRTPETLQACCCRSVRTVFDG
jgi:hypothetical protein